MEVNVTYADGVDASLLQRTSLLSDWLSTINPDWVITKCTVMSIDVWPSGVVGFLELDVTYSIGSNTHNHLIIFITYPPAPHPPSGLLTGY